jgi:hypothetical protein
MLEDITFRVYHYLGKSIWDFEDLSFEDSIKFMSEDPWKSYVIHPIGSDLVIWKEFNSLDLYYGKPKSDVNNPNVWELPEITARSILKYEHILNHARPKPLLNLNLKYFLGKTVIDEAGGLAEFTPMLAELKAEKDDQVLPILIDPLPYHLVKEILLGFKTSFGNLDITNKEYDNSISISEAIRRIDIILNPSLVRLYNVVFNLDGRLHPELEELKNTGDVGIEVWGSISKNLGGSEKNFRELLKPDGELYIGCYNK